MISSTETAQPIPRPVRRTWRCAVMRMTPKLAVLMLAVLAGGGSIAQAAPDSKPYDEQLARLAEILGAVHYLRELCSANEGQIWRQHMRELLDAESGSAVRKARLTRAFNQGYRNYSRTYTTCTPSAQVVIDRFVAEGVEISETLAERAP